MQVQEIIKKKIKEHEQEMTGCQINLDALQTNLTGTKRPDINKIARLATVKDKMLFHKAAKAVLEDLLREI